VAATAVRDPSSRYQLDRIYDLIAAAQYSFHDLSMMSRTPRLNMAFELGLAVAISRSAGAMQQWFIFDTVPHRLESALSDLGGIRPLIHDFTPESVLRGLMNALVREKHQPTFASLLAVYRDVEAAGRRIKRNYSHDLFDARPFAELTVAANETARARIPTLAT
jgi:hypothetical protein